LSENSNLIIEKLSGVFGVKYVCLADLIVDAGLNVDELFNAMERVEKQLNVVVQAVNPNYIVSVRHVLSAALKALRAFHTGQNICNKIGIELLLYLSGKRQIRDAIKIVGVRGNLDRVLLISIGDSREHAENAIKSLVKLLGKYRLDRLILELNDEKVNLIKMAYGISDIEISAVMRRDLSLRDAIERLVIERGALLDIYK